jgi:benzoyl-CoA reductase/2-hydroxyglutaryl-CoA dehydratase subunit BcrC/BadD/HgdB
LSLEEKEDFYKPFPVKRNSEIETNGKEEKRRNATMGNAWKKILEAGQEQDLSARIRTWKEQGKQVVGWLCRYVPIELIQAAGMVPLRILGDRSEEHTMGDAYLSVISCPFCRSVIHGALKGSYRELDGVVSTNSCCSMNRLMDVWAQYLRNPLLCTLDLPYNHTPNTVRAFRGELERFKQALEGLRGKNISDDELWESTEVIERTRQLLRNLYEVRKDPDRSIPGSEVLAAVLAGMTLPPKEYNSLLEEALEELRDREPCPTDLPRVLISGSILLEPRYLKAIEDQGVLVVADDLCTGSRFWLWRP